MTGIASDMVRVCPDAYLLNYSNPMAMLPWAVYAGTSFRNVYGLCHSVRDTHAFLAGLVGVEEDQVRFVTAGFNHQAFVLRFEHEDRSLYPRLAEIIEDSSELQRRVRVEIFRRFGYFPTESSEHSAEYVPWFMRHDEEIGRFRIFVGDYLARSQENLRELEDLQVQLESGTPLDLEPADELASQFIHSVESGKAREIYVNVRNDGLITNLPADCCVEVPCEVDGDGARPQAVGALPPQLAALNRTFLNVVELTVRAALEGSRDHVYQAALLVSGNTVYDDPGTSASDPSTGTNPPGAPGASTVAGHDPYALYIDAFGNNATITDVYVHDNTLQNQNQSQYHLTPGDGMPVVDLGGVWSNVQIWHNTIEGKGAADRYNPLLEVDKQPAAGTSVVNCNDYADLSTASNTVNGNFALPGNDWLTLPDWQAHNGHGWDADSQVGGFSASCPAQSRP